MRFIFSLIIVLLLVLSLSYGNTILNEKWSALDDVLGDSDSSEQLEESDDPASDQESSDNSTETEDSTTAIQTATFIFDGQSVPYVDGMTWQDFVDSEYNTLNFTIKSGDVCDENGTYVRCYNFNNGDIVSADHFIQSGKTYSTEKQTATFIFDGQYVTYEVGMTWDAFIGSTYNTIGLVRYNYVAAFSQTKYLVKSGTTSYLALGDSIEQANYTVHVDTSGGMLV